MEPCWKQRAVIEGRWRRAWSMSEIKTGAIADAESKQEVETHDLLYVIIICIESTKAVVYCGKTTSRRCHDTRRSVMYNVGLHFDCKTFTLCDMWILDECIGTNQRFTKGQLVEMKQWLITNLGESLTPSFGDSQSPLVTLIHSFVHHQLSEWQLFNVRQNPQAIVAPPKKRKQRRQYARVGGRFVSDKTVDTLPPEQPSPHRRRRASSDLLAEMAPPSKRHQQQM